MQPMTYYQQPFTQITTQSIPVIEKIIREKDSGLEDKVALLTTEIQRLQTALQMKNEELQEMSNKYHQLYQTIEQKQTSDNSIQVILNENKKIREEIETWKKSYLQFEENYQHLDKLRKEEERQKLTYSAENEKLKLEINQFKEKLFQSENQLSQLKFQFNQETISKMSEMEHTLLIKTQQIEEYQKKVTTYESQQKVIDQQDTAKAQIMYNRFVLVATENERIHKILRQVLAENDNERENSAMLMQKIEIYENQIKDSSQLENQVSLLSTEIQRLQSELEEKNQLVQQQQTEYNSAIYTKEKMITELKNSTYQLDFKNNQKVQELENKVVNFTTEIERLQELRISFDQQVRKDEQKWKQQIQEKDQKIYQLEEKLSQLATELSRLKGIIDEKANEISNTQSQFYFLIKLIDCIVFKAIHQKFKKLQQVIKSQISLTMNCQIRCKNYNKKIRLCCQQFQPMKKKLGNCQQNQNISKEFVIGLKIVCLYIDSLEIQQKDGQEKLTQENKKLQDKLLNYEQKCTHLSNEILRLQQQNSTYSDENSQLQFKMQSLSQELLKLDGMFKQSSSELEKFKKYTAQQQETILQFEDEKKKMKQQSSSTAMKLSQQEETITTITTTITEREQQIMMLQEQLTLLLNEFKSLESEHQATNNYLTKYQSKQMSFDLSIEKNKKLLMNFVLICTEVEALRNRIKSLQDDNAQARISLVKQAEIVQQSQFLPRTSTQQVYETVRISKQQSQF